MAFVLTNWSQYAPDPLSIFRVWEGGMSYFGGFGLAIATAIYIIRARRIPVWQLGDLAAPSLALGYGIARIGCFAAGCCYGAPTDLPWGVQFPGHTHAVHPTQLYATAMNLLIFAGLSWWELRRRFSGQLFALFLVLHGLYRFINEFFRAGATSVPNDRRVHLRASGRRVGDSDRHRASLGTGATARAHARQKRLECCMILQSTRTTPYTRRRRGSPRSLDPLCRTSPTGAGGRCALQAHCASPQGCAACYTG
jgi:hypothetical protein